MKKYRITALPKMQDGGRFPVSRSKGLKGQDIVNLNWQHPYIKELYDEYESTLDQEVLDAASEDDGQEITNNFVKWLNRPNEDGAPTYGIYFAPNYNYTDDDGNKQISGFAPWEPGAIIDAIYSRGATAQEFENMGLGKKEFISESFKDIFDIHDQVYNQLNKEKILQEVGKGKSKKEIIDQLLKEGMGKDAESLENYFGDDVDESQDELLKFYQEALNENEDDLAYGKYIDPALVGKKSMAVDSEGNQIFSPQNLRGNDITASEEYLKEKSEAEQDDLLQRIEGSPASTLSRENAPGVDALNRQAYENMQGIYNMNPRNAGKENTISYEDWLSGVNLGTERYNPESLEQYTKDMAPDPEAKPNLADYIGEDAAGLASIEGVPSILTKLRGASLTDPQKKAYERYKEDLERWENTPSFMGKYANALYSKMLSDKLGLDDVENMSQEEKQNVLRMFSEDANRSEGVLKYDTETGEYVPLWDYGLTNIEDEVATNLERKLDPENYYERSTLEDDQPSVLGNLFDYFTGENMFADYAPVVEKSLDFDPETGELLPEDQRNIYNGLDIKRFTTPKGTGVFEDFNLPTEGILGFDLNLAPTGIGSVGLQGANALVKGSQAGSKFRGIPGFKGFTGKALGKAYRQPVTKTLGLDAAGKLTGIRMPQFARNLNKFATPANALHAHYLANADEYIGNAIQEDLPSAYKNLMEGKYKDAATDAAMGAWGLSSVMPFVRGARALKNLRGTKGTIEAPFLKDYTVGLRGRNTGVQFNPREGKDIKSLFSIGDPTGRFAFGVGKYRPKFGEGMNQNLQLQKEGGITQAKSKIKGAGDGMFTTRGFKKGEMIGLAHRDDQPASKLGRMHNHNEDSPTMFSEKIGNERYVFANRDLEPGEELTTNYRMQPELEQPEDFQKGGSVSWDLPKAQRGRGIVKTLADFKRDLPRIIPHSIVTPKMDQRTFDKYKTLTDLMVGYGYTGVPKNTSRNFSGPEQEVFQRVQMNANRKKLRNALQNTNISREEIAALLTNSQINKGLLVPDSQGRLVASSDKIGKARRLIGTKSRQELIDILDEAIAATANRNLIKPDYDPFRIVSGDEAIRQMEQLGSIDGGGGLNQVVSTLKAADLRSGEQPLGRYSLMRDFMDDVILKPSVGSLFRNQYGNDRELFNAFQEKLNRGFHGAKPNSIVTGSLDTSDDSYAMQQGRLLRATRGTDPEVAAKIPNVLPYPIFLGYKPANSMGDLASLISDSSLGIRRKDQLDIRAQYLQKQLNDMYDRQGVIEEHRLPILQTQDAPDYGRSYITNPYDMELPENAIMLPQFGVMKTDFKFPEGKKRPLLSEGGDVKECPPGEIWNGKYCAKIERITSEGKEVDVVRTPYEIENPSEEEAYTEFQSVDEIRDILKRGKEQGYDDAMMDKQICHSGNCRTVMMDEDTEIQTIEPTVKRRLPTMVEAYETVDKDKYPTFEDFEYAAEYYKEHGENPPDDELPSNRVIEEETIEEEPIEEVEEEYIDEGLGEISFPELDPMAFETYSPEFSPVDLEPFPEMPWSEPTRGRLRERDPGARRVRHQGRQWGGLKGNLQKIFTDKKYAGSLFRKRIKEYGGMPEFQTGGSVETELTQKEIDNLIKQGYIIEDL